MEAGEAEEVREAGEVREVTEEFAGEVLLKTSSPAPPAPPAPPALLKNPPLASNPHPSRSSACGKSSLSEHSLGQSRLVDSGSDR